MAPVPLSVTLTAAGQRSAADWVLGGLGVSAAAVSASFAIYMVAIGPGQRASPPSGDFNVFVSFDRRSRAIPPPEAAILPPVVTAPAPSVQTAGSSQPDIDYTPTGSIAPPPARRDTMPALSGSAKPSSEATRTLAGFSIRDVFDGKAVIEARNRLTIVEPGSIVEGAGEVLAIRRKGAGWMVETAGGVITQ